MKTQFAGKSPFAQKKTVKFIDVATLVISDDPMPERRTPASDKYSALFEKLKVGKCIICQPHEASKIGHALNTWLDKKGMTNMVKTTKHYEKDGLGRVWLLAPRSVKLKAA